MSKRLCIFLLLIMCLLFSGCEAYPKVQYWDSSLRFNEKSFECLIEEGYQISHDKPYEWVETDSGKDLIIHFEKEK